jgi:hypothetical protein
LRRKEVGEGVGKDGSEYESMSGGFETEDGDCEGTEAGIGDRYGEQGETGEAELRLVISGRRVTQ